MITGLCWPSSGPTFGPLDPDFLRFVLDVTGVKWLRLNCDHRNPHVDRLVEQVRQADASVLPILDADYAALKADDSAQLAAFTAFAGDFVKRWRFPYAEILNEPWTMHGLPAPTYARIATTIGRALRERAPQTAVLVAAEILRPHRAGPRPQRYFGDVRQGLQPDLWDIAAIHHYREPGAPDVSDFDDRGAEHRYVLEQTGGKPVMATEVGWHGDHLRAADYLTRELDINRQLGVLATFIYCHDADPAWDFGVTCRGQARPQAHAIRDWLQAPPRSVIFQKQTRSFWARLLRLFR